MLMGLQKGIYNLAHTSDSFIGLVREMLWARSTSISRNRMALFDRFWMR